MNDNREQSQEQQGEEQPKPMNANPLADFLGENVPKQGNVSEEEEEEEEENVAASEKGSDDGLGDNPKEEDKEGKKEPKEENKKPEEGEEDTVIHVVASAFQDEFEIEGEFEDDSEGLIAVTKQIATKSREAGKEEGVKDLFTKIPLLQDVYNHLEKGGSLTSLIQQKEVEDFEKVDIKDDDLDTAEKMYRSALEFRGNDEESIETLISAAKDNGTLVEKGKKGKALLVEAQKEVIQNTIKEEEAQRQAELKQVKEIQDKVKNILNNKKINGLDITAESASRFDDFVFKTDNQGKTERDRKYEALTLEQQMLIDLLVMDDFKMIGGVKPSAPVKKPLKFSVKKANPTVNLNSSKGGEAISKLGIDDVRDLFK